MAFIPILNCAEVVIHGTVGAKAVANVLGFKFTGVYTPTDMQQLADSVDLSVGSFYKAAMSAGMSYDFCEARGLTSSIDISASSAVSAGLGGVSGAQLTNNVTLCFTLRSANTGRSARGRFYAFPTGISQLTAANTFSSGYAADIVNFLNDVRTNAAILGWTMSVLSRQHAGVPLAAGVAYPIISAAARNLISDSQRGRLPKGH